MSTPQRPTILEAFGILREQRQQQIDFALLADACIRDKKNAAIEAGTGTGKSFGYLIPIVSQGRKAIVSTGTIALQEQLIRQDLPFLKRAMADRFGICFKFAMLKGQANYACKRRLDEVGANLPEELAEWADYTSTGDLGEAPEMTLSDKEAIRIDADDCGRQQCPFWSECYHQRAKEVAKAADVLVVVHAMTTMGLGEPYGLDFNGYDALIVDEAHQFEDYARGSFEGRLSPSRLSKFFKAVDSVLVDGSNRVHWEAARDAFRSAWAEVIRPWMPKQHADGSKFDDEKLLIDVRWLREASAPALEALSDVASFVSSNTEESDPEHMKILRQLDNIRAFFQELAAGDAIAVAERRLNDDQQWAMVTMSTFPLFVGGRLAKDLYPTLPVIFTSATISAGGDFSMLKEALALDYDAPTAEIASPFDYPKQALLYVPRDPRFEGKAANPAHAAAAREEMETLIKLSRGRTFCLFTSNKAMREAYQARRHPFPSRWQEPDSNKNALIQWFRETEGAVLYATASFWEGVSIEGPALSLVIIDRIPFPPPNDPVYKAKEAKCPAGKGFQRLMMPSAILKLKQGFGRLIRTLTDRGMVAILDSRCHSYGRRILLALPPATLITSLDDRELIAEYLSGSLPASAPVPLAAVQQMTTSEVAAPVIDVPAVRVEPAPAPSLSDRIRNAGSTWSNATPHPANTPAITMAPADLDWAAIEAWEMSF